MSKDHHERHRHTRRWWNSAPILHDHAHGGHVVDAAFETNALGAHALWQSLAILGLTAFFQLIIALMSHSASLLAETIHNLADALTAVPLLIAFRLARRPPTSRFTYGYGRIEDVAGVVIVLIIAASAALALWESAQKLLHPSALNQIRWVIGAAIVGFLGNELVARVRIRTGRAIDSAALVADGQHAHADGFTSLAVLLGALGSLIGVPLLDPLVGLLMTSAILAILRQAATAVWGRLIDALDPDVVSTIAHAASLVPAVQGTHALRARWIGHELFAELHVSVPGELPTSASHRIGDAVRDAILRAVPRLASLTVHIDPHERDADVSGDP